MLELLDLEGTMKRISPKAFEWCKNRLERSKPRLIMIRSRVDSRLILTVILHEYEYENECDCEY